MKKVGLVVGSALVVASAVVACSESATPVDASDAAATDAAVADSATPTPVADASTVDAAVADSAVATDAAVPAGNSYDLNGARSVAQTVQCQPGGGTYLIAGVAADRTGFGFYFRGGNPPAPGTYTVEPPVDFGPPVNNTPASATGVIVRYFSDPQGGTPLRYYAQSGSVTVTQPNGKARAAGTALPATEIGSQTAGAIGGQLVCP